MFTRREKESGEKALLRHKLTEKEFSEMIIELFKKNTILSLKANGELYLDMRELIKIAKEKEYVK